MPKGHTNNPSGRLPGTGVVARLRRELLGEGKVTQLVDKAFEMAMAGDAPAMCLLLDRVLPALRIRAVLVSVPLNPADTLTAKATALLQAAADGELPADIASELIRAVASVCAITEAEDLRQR